MRVNDSFICVIPLYKVQSTLQIHKLYMSLLLFLLLIPNCFKTGYFKYAFLCKRRVLCLGFGHKVLQEPLNIFLKNNDNDDIV